MVATQEVLMFHDVSLPIMAAVQTKWGAASPEGTLTRNNFIFHTNMVTEVPSRWALFTVDEMLCHWSTFSARVVGNRNHEKWHYGLSRYCFRFTYKKCINVPLWYSMFCRIQPHTKKGCWCWIYMYLLQF